MDDQELKNYSSTATEQATRAVIKQIKQNKNTKNMYLRQGIKVILFGLLVSNIHSRYAFMSNYDNKYSTSL